MRRFRLAFRTQANCQTQCLNYSRSIGQNAEDRPRFAASVSCASLSSPAVWVFIAKAKMPDFEVYWLTGARAAHAEPLYRDHGRRVSVQVFPRSRGAGDSYRRTAASCRESHAGLAFCWRHSSLFSG